MTSCVSKAVFDFKSASNTDFQQGINEFPGIHPIVIKVFWWADQNSIPSNKMSNTGNNYSSDDLTVEKMLNKG